MNNDDEIRIFKLSESPLFKSGNNSKININSVSYDDNGYDNALSDAERKGIAFTIDGEEPSDEELVNIKQIYDRFGAVKIFRRRKKDVKPLSDKNKFSKEVSIRPSNFNGIGGTELDREEIANLKQSVCHHIVELIRG
jgi:hypothetical protein